MFEDIDDQFFFEPEKGMGQIMGSDEPFDILPPDEFQNRLTKDTPKDLDHESSTDSASPLQSLIKSESS